MGGVYEEFFGCMPDGREVGAYTLCNQKGMRVKITAYGGALMQIFAPDREGRFRDILCGYDSLDDYRQAGGYQGALIGRWGNRIGGARFTLDGVEYVLGANEDGRNLLHGGHHGFNEKLWTAEMRENSLVLSTLSPHGEEGFPGELRVSVTYTLTEDNQLILDYDAVTDQKTVINLTNHAYFNLGGYASGTVFDHELWLDADSYLETDEMLIPTGRMIPVEGTPFDFRTAKPIGRDIAVDHRDLHIGGGYDHCFNLVGGKQTKPVLRGELYHPASGRLMQILTDQPCIQLYTGNVMTEPVPFKGGYPQQKHHALCLETQTMPDSMHHANFTDATLSPGQRYGTRTIYAFSCR
ncbi:MAG: galactose mutarotase [Clostridia bacterium]|nr:galactose mutarotase [Clostridia bacterium]